MQFVRNNCRWKTTTLNRFWQPPSTPPPHYPNHSLICYDATNTWFEKTLAKPMKPCGFTIHSIYIIISKPLIHVGFSKNIERITMTLGLHHLLKSRRKNEKGLWWCWGGRGVARGIIVMIIQLNKRFRKQCSSSLNVRHICRRIRHGDTSTTIIIKAEYGTNKWSLKEISNKKFLTGSEHDEVQQNIR